MSLKKKFFSFLTTLVMILGSTPFSFVRSAYAAEGDLPEPSLPTPATDKQLIENGDGTYTIALSVTGKQSGGSTTACSGANVVLVLDTSQSMDGNNTTYNGQRMSRFAAEKRILTEDNGIIDQMLSKNTSTCRNMVEVAVASFGIKGHKNLDFTNDPSTLKRTINGLGYDNGTNWEEGLIYAKEYADDIKTRQPSEDVYIVFMTDGEPSTSREDTRIELSTNSYQRNWGYAKDNAQDLVNAGYHFYGVYTWGVPGSSHYLSSLVQYAYTGNGNYNTALSSQYEKYFADAVDSEAVVDALVTITNEITTNVGYTNVGLTDGVTSMTDSSVKTSTNGEVRGLKYYRSGGRYSTTANDGLGEEWADAPKATINNNGEVDWKLGDLVLENGVTYTVVFVVWPKQDSLDLVADLNNGVVSYDSLTAEQRAQIAGSDGSYTLKTNTDFPTVTYSTVTTTTIDGQTNKEYSRSVTKPIENPDPVGLYSGSLSVEKKWEDGLDPIQQDDFNGVVTLNLYEDGDDDAHIVNTYVLEKANGWKSDTPYAISPGVMVYSTSKAVQDEDYTAIRYDGDGKDYVILEEGHDYHYDEPAITGHYYLTKHIYHPMVVNGEVKNVLFKYDENKQIIGIEKIESLTTLSATNTLKGGISIFKEVYDGDEKIENLDETFTIKLSFKDPSYGYTYRIYYGGNNPCGKANADATACKLDSNSTSRRTIKMTGTGVLEQEIYVGDEIMVIDVETGTKFKVEEITDGMKSWYEFSEVQHDISRNAKNQYGAYKSSEIDGDYRTVQANSSSRATVKNNYITGDLKISKTVNVESGNEAKAKSNEFDFTVNVYTNNDKIEKLTDYSKTFKLSNGESESITDIPAGTYYEVAETGASGFTTTSTGESGTIAKDTTSKADFVNTYKVEPKNAQAKVTKMFGDYWDLTKINGFEFTLTPKTTSTGTYPEIVASNLTATSVLPASWTFKILDEGTWTYEVTEKEYDHPGVFPSTDNEVVTLTVKATDNGDGTLNITKTYSKNATNVDEDNATINNSYKTLNTVSETIKVKKTVVDNVTGNHNANFTFILSGDAEDEITFNSATSDGGSFSTLTFDKAGTYRYVVSEKNDGKGGWTYDDSTFEVVIEVTEDYTTAMLSSTMTINGKKTDTAEFSNEYKVTPTSATVSITKDFGDFWYEGDSFSFELASTDGTYSQIKSVDSLNKSVSFTINYDAPGDYEYTITEDTQFGRPGISLVTTDPITVKVSVVDNGNGTMTATVTEGETGTIENTYETKPSSAMLKVKKTINDLTNSKKDGSFTFDLKKASGSVLDTVTISTSNLSGEGSFKAIDFTKEGTYNYTIVERKGNTPGFSYDTVARNVEIVVKDNKETAKLYVDSIKIDGEETDTVEIENDYEAKKTSIELPATKSITGRKWLDTDEFEFTLSGDGIYDQTKAATKSEKTVTFDEIEYTKTGSFRYTIAESKDLPAGMTNKTGDITVTVTVEDDGKGALKATAEYSVKNQTIVNDYKTAATYAVLNVEKTINDLTNSKKDSDFTFDLKDSEGKKIDTVVVTTQNLSGNGSFGAIDFTEAGTYNYTIVEEDGGAAGFSYDTTARKVQIVVKDNTEEAKLYVDSITIDGEKTDTAKIENDYEAKKTSIKLSATKAIEGRDWLDSDKFTFELTGDNIKAQTKTATKSTPTVTFNKIEYTKTGTYNYTISETGKLPAGMENKTGDIAVTVTVEDDGNGALKATAKYSVENQTIVNAYSTKPVSVKFNIEKTIKDLSNSKKDAKFRFAFGEAQYEIATTDLKGELNNEIELIFDKEQTLEFEVFEINDQQAGFTYDSKVYTVKVKVADNYEKAELGATITVDGKKISGNEYVFEFTNQYQAAATETRFGIQKVIDILNGEIEADEDFKFELADAKNKVLETVTITGEGEAIFAPIKFKKVGAHKYTISEIIGSAKYYEYDPTIYEVVVNVIDNNGQLMIESTSTKILGSDDDVEVVVFTNTYNKEEKEEEPKTPDTGRFTTDGSAASEVTSSVVAGMVILFGVLLGLIKNKSWRGLIRARRNDIIARNE